MLGSEDISDHTAPEVVDIQMSPPLTVAIILDPSEDDVIEVQLCVLMMPEDISDHTAPDVVDIQMSPPLTVAANTDPSADEVMEFQL
jgi:hypothetical protein